MERLREVRALLKRWESDFQRERQRKPNQEDIREAPEDTRRLYKEYQALKKLREDPEPPQEPPQVPDRGSWGSHLNRQPRPPRQSPLPKLGVQSLGMRLKSKLGALGKEPPLTLRRTPTPRRTPPAPPLEAEKVTSDKATPEVSPEELLLPPPLRVSPQLLLLTLKPPKTPPAQKFQKLRKEVTQRLGSLDPDWLQRCQGTLGDKGTTLEVAGSHLEKTGNSRREKTPGEGGGDDLLGPTKLHQCHEGMLEEEEGMLEEEEEGQVTLGDKRTIKEVAGSHLEKTGNSRREKTPGEGGDDGDDDVLGPTRLHQCHEGMLEEEEEGQVTLGDKRTIKEVAGTHLEKTGNSRRKRPRGDGGSDGEDDVLGPTKLHKCPERAFEEEEGTFEEEEEGQVTLGDKRTTLEVAGSHLEKTGNSRRKRPRGDGGSDGEDDVLGPTKLHQCPERTFEEEEEGQGTLGHKRTTREVAGTHLEKIGNSRRKRPRGDGGGDDVLGPTKLHQCPERTVEEEEGTFEEEGHVATQKDRGKPLDPSKNFSRKMKEVEEEAPKPPRRATPLNAANFVRLNLKRKSYTRGPSRRGSHLRKKVWKEKWKKKAQFFGGGGNSNVCFGCGGTGHWAAACRGGGNALREEENGPKEEEEEEEDPLPTLEEVARRTNTVLPEFSENSQSSWGSPVSPQVWRPQLEPPAPPNPVEPLYTPGPEGKVPAEPPDEVLEALKMFGYSSFRPGQELPIMRILSGLSTLVVLPTGMGKSLCYQLPALLYHQRSKSITLVISPLVSLMDDQTSGLPPCLKAICLHSNMTKTQRESSMEKVRRGEVQVLLMSPEALVGSEPGSGFLPGVPNLPPVAFACIDEAHCLSEWSHNFRPSYLRICKVLRDRLGVRCFLGLTATATLATTRDVAKHLGISQEEEGKIPRFTPIPPNLLLSVSLDRYRDEALISLLQGERFGSLDSIIVYCTRREETARLAALIRTSLQGIPPHQPTTDPKKNQPKGKKPPLQLVADAYHAGLSPSQRRGVQKNFMRGHLRVVVATVAFGMGLDKQNVRGVIHYNMPKNFETYVQEIGRAGRDGEPAWCHLFLDPEGEDLHELRRHIYGDTVDFVTVKKLVQMVFKPCRCLELHQKHQELVKDTEVEDSEMAKLLEEEEEEEKEKEEEEEDSRTFQPSVQRVCYKHERTIPIQPTVETLDLREEGIETLLCYLELHPRRWLELLHPTYSTCRIRSYGGARQLREAARSSPPIAVFLARERLVGRDHGQSSSLEFNVVSLSDSMGWEVPLVKRSLRQLQWDPQLCRGGKSGILVEFEDLSFHFRTYGDLTARELDYLCDFLHGKVVAREKMALGQLQACFRAFQSVAFQTCDLHPEEEEEERSSQLKALLQDYFEKEPREEEEEEEDEEEAPGDTMQPPEQETQIRADIRRFLALRPEENFSGRAVARIFHGIGSPRFPAQVFGRDRRFWRRHLHFSFHRLIRLATQEILATR